MNSHEQIKVIQETFIRAIYRQDDVQGFDSKGIEAYRGNLLENARRALAISFPTLAQLIGEEGFALLVSEFIQDHPFSQGDWGEWGSSLPDWIAKHEQFNEYPYLADCGSLDWIHHCCERSKDMMLDADSLSLLETADPYELSFQYADGVRFLQSSYPIVDIWKAHHINSIDKQVVDGLMTQASASLANAIGQTAFVWRPLWKVEVSALDTTLLTWLQYTMTGNSIGSSLDQMQASEFSFEEWLPHAINNRIIVGIKSIED